MAYSLDLRKKVLGYLRKGGTATDAVQLFEITERTIRNWLKREKEQNLAPKSRRSGSYKIDEEKLRRYIETNPDAYLREIAVEFGTTLQAIFYACIRLKITLKKRRQNTRNEMKKHVKSSLSK